MTDTTALVRFSPHALAALRIMAGLLFLAHGTVKLFGWPEVEGMGRVELLSLSGVGGVIELVAGALVALGLFTRPAAFVASGEMAVAYFMFHAQQGFYPVANGGDGAILYCFIFLYLVFAGPGSFSLDGLFRSRAAVERRASA